MSIWLCSNGHAEICHEGTSCPFCDEISDKKQIVEAKDNKLDELKNKIEELESQ